MKEFQKEMGHNHCLKILVATGEAPTYIEQSSEMKKNVLKHSAVNEDKNVSKSLRSSVLDDGMLWMYVQKLGS